MIIEQYLFDYRDFENSDYDKVNFIDLVPVFDRPHDYGELFLDFLHISAKGYSIIANKIHDFLFAEDQENIKYTCTQEKKPVKITPSLQDRELDSTENQINDYLEYLKSEKMSLSKNIGAIVMNCNPFTLGHEYLISKASSEVDYLYVFCVEEDKSEFTFEERLWMINSGIKGLNNVKVLRSGKHIISTMTFPEYFSKSKDFSQEMTIDPTKDLEIFAKIIAPVLNIQIRFVGSEPICNITKQYNNAMKEVMESNGIIFKAFERKEFGNMPISASYVRELISKKEYKEISQIVPESTMILLKKKYSMRLD